MRFLPSFILCVLCTVHLNAQKESFALRIQGGLNAAFHNASFTSTGDIIDCGELGSGVGIGPVFNGIVEIPLSTSMGIGIGIGYADRSVSFIRTNTYPVRDTANNTESILTTDMELASSFSFLEIQPDLRVALIDDYEHRALGLIIGPRIALPLTSRFEQTETVVTPENAVFVVDGNPTQQREIKSGPYTTRSQVQYGASLGFETLIRLSEKTMLTPALSFDAFFNDLMTDATWKTWGARLEVGVRFAFHKKFEAAPLQSEPPPPPPPVIAFAPVGVGITNTVFVGEVITGSMLTATTPIVNAVFFDSASASVPLNYRRSLDGSIPSTDPAEAHAWVLPRIAQIMKSNEGASIVLEGATSGSATEPDGVSLARKRAESVRDVLVGMGVSQRSIEVKASINPRVMSNPEFAGGREENRRVDVIVHNAPLQEWVSTAQFAEVRGTMKLNPARMGGDPSLRDSSKVQLNVAGIDTTVRGNASSVAVPVKISVNPDQTTAPIRITASSDGAFAKKDTSLDLSTLSRREVELQTENFEAILRFEYNSAELTNDVKQLLQQLSERIPNSSTIEIQGSADILGSEERNKVLSDSRASNTKQFIESIAKNRFKINVSQSDKVISNDTPHGRFLNRSIRIRVTPPSK